MPILAIISGQKITKEMYELLRPEVNWERKHPVGLILHAASFDEGGAHIADLWESVEALNEFMSSRLKPAMKKFNVPAPDDVKVYPTHNINAYAAIDRYTQ